MRNSLTRLILFTALVGVAGTVNAEVTRVDIAKRTEVGASGYEKIVGTIHFAVDPANPRNSVIVDLDAAKKNAAGRVEFSADLYILRPRDQARSNGVALVEVSNRGRMGLLNFFNRGPAESDPSKDADLGDGFLTQQGYTLVWVGWQFDVPRQGGLMKLDAPVSSRQRPRARRVHDQRSRAGVCTGRSRRLFAVRSGCGRRDAHGSRWSVRDDDHDPARPVAAPRQQRRLDRRRVRAGTYL